jgi:sugar phosphate isomerase/epimerase
MKTFTRRQMFGAAAGAMAVAAVPSGAADPPKRTGGSRMRLSLAAYSFRDFLTGKKEPKMNLEEFIDRCAAMDLDAVELTSYYFPKDVTPEYIARLKRQCHILGLDISGSPVGNTFTHPAGPLRDKELAHVKMWIDYAAMLGSPAIRIFAGSTQPGQSKEDAKKMAVETIEIACEHAAKRGVFLGLENHGGIVAEADDLLDIVKAVKSEWCGVNLDTGNFHTTDPYADLEKCAPYAVTVQVKTEITPKGGSKQEADLKREIEILKKVGYRGYVTLEYEAAEDPLKAVPKYLSELRALL